MTLSAKTSRTLGEHKAGFQGHIQIWLRGGSEFQLVELMYNLGENEIILIWLDIFKATYQGKVAMNLNPEVDVWGGGSRGECNTHQIVARI